VKTVYIVFSREKKASRPRGTYPIYATALRQVGDSHPGSSPKDKKRKREREREGKKRSGMGRIGVYVRGRAQREIEGSSREVGDKCKKRERVNAVRCYNGFYPKIWERASRAHTRARKYVERNVRVFAIALLPLPPACLLTSIFSRLRDVNVDSIDSDTLARHRNERA